MSQFLHGLAKNRASNIGREPQKFVVEILFLWKKEQKFWTFFWEHWKLLIFKTPWYQGTVRDWDLRFKKIYIFNIYKSIHNLKKFVKLENMKTQKNIECITTKGRCDNQMVGKELNKYKSISKYNKYKYEKIITLSWIWTQVRSMTSERANP